MVLKSELPSRPVRPKMHGFKSSPYRFRLSPCRSPASKTQRRSQGQPTSCDRISQSSRCGPLPARPRRRPGPTSTTPRPHSPRGRFSKESWRSTKSITPTCIAARTDWLSGPPNVTSKPARKSGPSSTRRAASRSSSRPARRKRSTWSRGRGAMQTYGQETRSWRAKWSTIRTSCLGTRPPSGRGPSYGTFP